MLKSLNGNEGLIFKEDFLELRWEAQNVLLVADWSGWLDSTKAKEGCLKMVEAVKEFHAYKILNDNSQVTGHSGDTRWMDRVWFPALKAAGVQYFGWVYSREFFTQLDIDHTVDNTTGIGIRTFLSADDARQWLDLY